tara:strand:+ start:2673 stop:3608 length:936 start_codon:yes stop_codon:yes gene_type:complete
MDELVSVIIPSYNKQDFIEQSIDSVINQTYKNIEIIVVDDCSSDKTLDILKKYKNKIKLYVNNINKGASFCRNYGFKKSKGKYIAHLDCDDYYHKNKIFNSINYINKNDHFFIYTNVNLINSYGKIIKNNNNIQSIGEGDISKKLLLNEISITNSTLVARRECFNKIGLFDEKIFLAADREMLTRLSLNYKAGFINEQLTFYRVHTNNMFINIDNTIKEFVYILYKNKNNNIFKNKNFFNTCLCNIYYNYSKFYIMFSDYKKSKKLLFKILMSNIYYKNNHLVLLLILLVYLFPSFLKNYLRKKYLNYEAK